MPSRLADGRLRLVMTADAVGGIWTYALDLARGLSAHGIDTTLAVLGPAPTRSQRDAATAIAGLDCRVTGEALDWTALDAHEVVSAGESVAAIARELRADLVQLNNPALASGVTFPAPIVAICHSCVATWWEAVRGGGALPPDLAWRRELVRRGYAEAEALVAPSAAFAAATARAYELAEAPRVVRNGRAPSPTPPMLDGAEGGEPFVFTSGRLWDEGKNIATLDRIAARLSVPVVAAGPLAGPNGCATSPSHIRSLGSRDASGIARHLARRPVFVSLARYEPFGLGVLEAAQGGCPLVLSDIPTFRELWDGAALFTPAEDDAFAALAIESLLGDAAQRRFWANAAAKRARRYTSEAMVAGMVETYHKVLAANFIGRSGGFADKRMASLPVAADAWS